MVMVPVLRFRHTAVGSVSDNGTNKKTSQTFIVSTINSDLDALPRIQSHHWIGYKLQRKYSISSFVLGGDEVIQNNMPRPLISATKDSIR